MNSLVLLLVGVIAFFIAYKVYGGYLAKIFGLDPNRKTPAHTMKDGVDYVPTHPAVLLGHHFASIAGAGPIVGPVTAAIFGWLPAFLWIVIGGIFFGGVHDFGSLMASIRHKGKSIGVVINDNMGRQGKMLFNLFAWLTLALVIAVFVDVVAKTFVKVPAAGSASLLFMAVSVLYGLFVYRYNFPMVIGSVIGVTMIFISIALGIMFPLELTYNVWAIMMIVYIFIASLLPVWILLQPRDYLNSYLLYTMIGGAVIGLFMLHPSLELPAYTSFNTGLGYMFPVLFVTIACGAISGFHSLVSSGTTSKQLDKETHAKSIGYGGMLLESVLAIIALIAASMLTSADYAEALKGAGAVAIFAGGVAKFMNSFGLPLSIGTTFVSLTVSAFALTSLDTATRLGRYIFQEFFEKEEGDKNLGTNMYFATTITVAAGTLLVFSGQGLALWPVFGSANQLLAALALLAVSVWLAKMGYNNAVTKYPMYFMLAVTLTALVLFAYTNITKGNITLAAVSILLFILAIVLVSFASKVLKGTAASEKPDVKA